MSDIVSYSLKLKSDISESIRVCMPGIIESYDFKTQKANIKISMKELYDNGKEVDYPMVNNVPVVFLTSGGASITLPVNKGDTCLLLFADRDMGAWLRGGIGSKPDSTRMHNLSDAIAIMGLQSFSKVTGSKNNEDLAINYAGSSINITKSGDINITTTKVVNVKSVEAINIDSKDVNINSSQNINLTAKKDIVLNATEATNLISKNITINVAETITTNCKDAVLTASNEIKTSATKFTHTGNLIITGNLELGGIGSGKDGGVLNLKGGINSEGVFANNGNVDITGNLTTTGAITATGAIKSGEVSLSSHTHSYTMPIVGSTPTGVTPSTVGSPVGISTKLNRR